MEQDVVLNIRVSAEMKKALTEHARNFYGLPASQVVRFLIANELSEEGVKLNGAWITQKPNVSKTRIQGNKIITEWAGSSNNSKVK
jgi:hypothetical protein